MTLGRVKVVRSFKPPTAKPSASSNPPHITKVPAAPISTISTQIPPYPSPRLAWLILSLKRIYILLEEADVNYFQVLTVSARLCCASVLPPRHHPSPDKLKSCSASTTHFPTTMAAQLPIPIYTSVTQLFADLGLTADHAYVTSESSPPAAFI